MDDLIKEANALCAEAEETGDHGAWASVVRGLLDDVRRLQKRSEGTVLNRLRVTEVNTRRESYSVWRCFVTTEEGSEFEMPPELKDVLIDKLRSEKGLKLAIRLEIDDG